MTEEQRLQMITEQLILVRDNLFRGMSKSMQKLQARSINEVLELPNHTQSPQRTWVGLTDEERNSLYEAHHNKYDLPNQGSPDGMDYERAIEAKLKEKNR